MSGLTLDVLKRMEWAMEVGQYRESACPACGGLAPDHETFCELAAEIARLEAETVANAKGVYIAHPAPVVHRCAGCGHRWEGRLTGPELCGDCWRKVLWTWMLKANKP